MTRRIFVDTEWTAPPWAAGAALMWVGLADEHGRSWYGISSEAEIDPANNPFVAGAFRLISPDEPRLTRQQLAAAVVDFCGEVDEFWAWVPTVDSFAAFFGLGNEAQGLFDRHWDVDLQLLQGLVQPWPARWPGQLHNLRVAAAAAGVDLPPRAANHLHPRVHAEWNRDLFSRLRARPGTAQAVPAPGVAAPQPRPLRLPPGVDLRGELERMVRDGDIGAGFVVCGIGSVGPAAIRLADAVAGTVAAGPHEVLNLNGSVTRDGAHLHASLADASGRVFGGHVCHGTLVRTTAELLLLETPAWALRRTVDAATGFLELTVRPAQDG